MKKLEKGKVNYLNKKKCKVFKIGEVINYLYALNDGRLAIGGDKKIIIYNMKNYKKDLIIDCNYSPNLIYQLDDNKIFYINSCWTTIAYLSYYNFIVELSDKNYLDKTKEILPKNSRYNIIKEYSNSFLFGGISYEGNTKRIEKMIKINEKYEIVSSLKIDFEDFILIKNKMCVLTKNIILFYDIVKFKKMEKYFKAKDVTKIENYYNKFLLITTEKKVIIYDFIIFKEIKLINCPYMIEEIYVNFNRVYILYFDPDIIIDYEINEEGNYKQINSYSGGPLITQLKDGRLITECNQGIKIWI